MDKRTHLTSLYLSSMCPGLFLQPHLATVHCAATQILTNRKSNIFIWRIGSTSKLSSALVISSRRMPLRLYLCFMIFSLIPGYNFAPFEFFFCAFTDPQCLFLVLSVISLHTKAVPRTFAILC